MVMVIIMSEDYQIEDNAEKLADSPSAIILEFLNENGALSREDLIELLIEKLGLSRDEAEKIFEDYVERGKLEYNKAKGGYVWSHGSGRKSGFSKYTGVKTPPRRKARAPLHTVLHLPPDPHTVPMKSYFLARDNPGNLYYHPAMDKDRLAYLRAKEKMGAGADWPA